MLLRSASAARRHPSPRRTTRGPRPSTRRCRRDRVGSMAWRFTNTQVRGPPQGPHGAPRRAQGLQGRDRQGADAQGDDGDAFGRRRDDDPQGEDDGGQVSRLRPPSSPCPHKRCKLLESLCFSSQKSSKSAVLSPSLLHCSVRALCIAAPRAILVIRQRAAPVTATKAPQSWRPLASASTWVPQRRWS